MDRSWLEIDLNNVRHNAAAAAALAAKVRVGYGGHVARHPIPIAVVPVGYADGFARSL